jgi:hypothetical protein
MHSIIIIIIIIYDIEIKIFVVAASRIIVLLEERVRGSRTHLDKYYVRT